MANYQSIHSGNEVDQAVLDVLNITKLTNAGKGVVISSTGHFDTTELVKDPASKTAGDTLTFDGVTWVAAAPETGLPEATESGTAAIYVDGEWVAQPGYGYETTDGTVTIDPKFIASKEIQTMSVVPTTSREIIDLITLATEQEIPTATAVKSYIDEKQYLQLKIESINLWRENKNSSSSVLQSFVDYVLPVSSLQELRQYTSNDGTIRLFEGYNSTEGRKNILYIDGQWKDISLPDAFGASGIEPCSLHRTISLLSDRALFISRYATESTYPSLPMAVSFNMGNSFTECTEATDWKLRASETLSNTLRTPVFFKASNKYYAISDHQGRENLSNTHPILLSSLDGIHWSPDRVYNEELGEYVYKDVNYKTLFVNPLVNLSYITLPFEDAYFKYGECSYMSLGKYNNKTYFMYKLFVDYGSDSTEFFNVLSCVDENFLVSIINAFSSLDTSKEEYYEFYDQALDHVYYAFEFGDKLYLFKRSETTWHENETLVFDPIVNEFSFVTNFCSACVSGETSYLFARAPLVHDEYIYDSSIEYDLVSLDSGRYHIFKGLPNGAYEYIYTKFYENIVEAGPITMFSPLPYYDNNSYLHLGCIFLQYSEETDLYDNSSYLEGPRNTSARIFLNSLDVTSLIKQALAEVE